MGSFGGRLNLVELIHLFVEIIHVIIIVAKPYKQFTFLSFKVWIMNDNLVYIYRDVSISTNHILANGKKYPLENILWVDKQVLKPKHMIGRLLMFSGLPLLFGHAKLPLIGLVLMLLGLLHWRTAPLPYAVVICNSSGEQEVLVSENPQQLTILLALCT